MSQEKYLSEVEEAVGYLDPEEALPLLGCAACSCGQDAHETLEGEACPCTTEGCTCSHFIEEEPK